MNIIKAENYSEISKNFTGVVEWPDGTKFWYKNGKHHREDGPAREWVSGYKEWYKEGNCHREDGPAAEYVDGTKRWFLENQEYEQINLKDNIVLDSYEGKYNLMWYKLLGKDDVFECPDIPGLITK